MGSYGRCNFNYEDPDWHRFDGRFRIGSCLDLAGRKGRGIRVVDQILARLIVSF